MIAVDLFAGWGGFTEAAESVGVRVAWAANHSPLAVEAHRANHPNTEHACQDLRQADWTALPRYDVLLASPACQGHSQCSQPRRRLYHDEMRATAWAVIDCAEVTRPRAVIVENVLRFRRWQLYPLWREALAVLGYHVQELDVCATQFGVPQRRRRLVFVATRRPIKIEIPRPATEPPFAPCLERDAAGWMAVSSATENVQGRIRRGRARCGRRFLSQHVTNHWGVRLSEPIRTITTKNQWLLVDGDRYRMLTVRELARGMAFRDSYAWPAEASRVECIQGLGNAVPPPMVAPIIQQVASA